jgi:hypothetical protein
MMVVVVLLVHVTAPTEPYRGAVSCGGDLCTFGAFLPSPAEPYGVVPCFVSWHDTNSYGWNELIKAFSWTVDIMGSYAADMGSTTVSPAITLALRNAFRLNRFSDLNVWKTFIDDGRGRPPGSRNRPNRTL